jgi:threonine dehydratase
MTVHSQVDLSAIGAAAERIAPHVLATPAVPHEKLGGELGCRVFFKPENLQHTGSFKVRGATNAVLQLPDKLAKRGVVTHSSGNHAAALARAASLRGIPASIVMPENSLPGKIAAVRSFGIEPVFCQPTEDSRIETAEQVRKRTGATMIHPYDHPDVIAGQGTVGLELIEQIESLDVILAPVGGGGLLSGILIAIKSSNPHIKVFGVEPQLADDTARSFRSGTRQAPERFDTVADGLRAGVGEVTFPIIRQHAEEILTVSEQEIIRAARTMAEQVHLVAEPSGAVSFAGLLKHHGRFAKKNVAVVISGGNLNFGNCQFGNTHA